MPVNILSHRCPVCDGPITMESCLKVYHVSGLFRFLDEESEFISLNFTKYSREYLHWTCKTQLIEEISSKIENLIKF